MRTPKRVWILTDPSCRVLQDAAWDRGALLLANPTAVKEGAVAVEYVLAPKPAKVRKRTGADRG